MAGLIEGRDPIPSAFQDSGDVIVLLGTTREELGGSEFLRIIHGKKEGLPPRLDLEEAEKFNKVLLEAAEQKLLKSAHDLAEGGLSVALAEACLGAPEKALGCEVQVKVDSITEEALFFGESQSRAVVSIEKQKLQDLEALLKKHEFPYQVIGRVTGEVLNINDRIRVPHAVLRATWDNGIRRRMKE